jgi:hypothetical protein
MVEVSAVAMHAAAVAARREAQALRDESHARRRELRRRNADAERLRSSCLSSYLGLAQTRHVRYRSAWSDLDWRSPDRELDRILFSIEGDAP